MAIESRDLSEEIMPRLQANKREHRIRMARLPIEEKVRILVRLQIIALQARPPKGPNDRRMVWQIQP